MRDLIDILCEINDRFTHHGGVIEGNPLERYFYFIKHSEHGKNCSYAIKYRQLFEKHDMEAIRPLILEAAALLSSSTPNTSE